MPRVPSIASRQRRESCRRIREDGSPATVADAGPTPYAPRPMDIYLPIAGLSVNALVIIGLGGLVGLLTGMVGVGGGFLTTPILIF